MRMSQAWACPCPQLSYLYLLTFPHPHCQFQNWVSFHTCLPPFHSKPLTSFDKISFTSLRIRETGCKFCCSRCGPELVALLSPRKLLETQTPRALHYWFRLCVLIHKTLGGLFTIAVLHLFLLRCNWWSTLCKFKMYIDVNVSWFDSFIMFIVIWLLP